MASLSPAGKPPPLLLAAALAAAMAVPNPVSAQSVVQAGSNRISIDARQVPLATLLDELSKLVTVELLVVASDVEQKSVDVKVSEITPAEGIIEVLEKADVDFAITGGRGQPFRILVGSPDRMPSLRGIATTSPGQANAAARGGRQRGGRRADAGPNGGGRGSGNRGRNRDRDATRQERTAAPRDSVGAPGGYTGAPGDPYVEPDPYETEPPDPFESEPDPFGSEPDPFDSGFEPDDTASADAFPTFDFDNPAPFGNRQPSFATDGARLFVPPTTRQVASLSALLGFGLLFGLALVRFPDDAGGGEPGTAPDAKQSAE